MLSLLYNLCYTIFARQSSQCNLCYAIFALKSLLCTLCNAIFVTGLPSGNVMSHQQWSAPQRGLMSHDRRRMPQREATLPQGSACGAATRRGDAARRRAAHAEPSCRTRPTPYKENVVGPPGVSRALMSHATGTLIQKMLRGYLGLPGATSGHGENLIPGLLGLVGTLMSHATGTLIQKMLRGYSGLPGATSGNWD
jgi:hypothetical protein